jgi:hypothetical protein
MDNILGAMLDAGSFPSRWGCWLFSVAVGMLVLDRLGGVGAGEVSTGREVRDGDPTTTLESNIKCE